MGVTSGPQGNLYVASQPPRQSTLHKVGETAFTVLDQRKVPVIARGSPFAADGSSFVAPRQNLGVVRVNRSSPSFMVLSAVDPALLLTVPITTDTQGRIDTADDDNGRGTATADRLVFEPDGKRAASRLASEGRGRLGIVVAGAVAPCGAFEP